MVVAGLVPGRRRARRHYRSVLAALSELASRGVELRMLHASPPSRIFRRDFDRQKRLVDGGLELRLCPRTHLKLVIVDGRDLYLGSANWTGAGLGAKHEERRNFELGLLTQDERLVDAAQDAYERIWRGSECANCRVREVCPMPLDVLERSAQAIAPTAQGVGASVGSTQASVPTAPSKQDTKQPRKRRASSTRRVGAQRDPGLRAEPRAKSRRGGAGARRAKRAR
jgi:phosphatidylserine/phosphatidylglycerophosphate/cardiolipin synthase-like enzyme